MNTYNINKGIGRTVEFRGLKAQYLFIFAGGLLGILILVMILYMAGTSSYICLFLGAGGSSLIVWQTFSLNRKYGEHGLMKIGAKKDIHATSSAASQYDGIYSQFLNPVTYEKYSQEHYTGKQISAAGSGK